MLNTMIYDVDFPGGSIRKYRVNVISDNTYYQVYSEVFLHPTLSGILDSDKDTTTAKKGDQYIITKSIQRCMRKSTIGWNLFIAWKDGSEQHKLLSLMKESNPIEVAEFATDNGIS